MLEVLFFFLLAVIIGLLYAFFGYAFFRILLPFYAFFAGLSFGFKGVESLLGSGVLSSTMAIFVGIIIGIALAVIAYWFYEFAVYVFGIGVGYVMGYGLMLAFGFQDGIMPAVVGIAAAIVVGVLMVKASFPKILIMLLTAGGGAMAVMLGIFALFDKAPATVESLELTRYMVHASWFWTLLWLILATIGFVFQFTLTKGAEDLSKTQNWDELEKEMAAAKA